MQFKTFNEHLFLFIASFSWKLLYSNSKLHIFLTRQPSAPTFIALGRRRPSSGPAATAHGTTKTVALKGKTKVFVAWPFGFTKFLVYYVYYAYIKLIYIEERNLIALCVFKVCRTEPEPLSLFGYRTLKRTRKIIRKTKIQEDTRVKFDIKKQTNKN